MVARRLAIDLLLLEGEIIERTDRNQPGELPWKGASEVQDAPHRDYFLRDSHWCVRVEWHIQVPDRCGNRLTAAHRPRLGVQLLISHKLF